MQQSKIQNTKCQTQIPVGGRSGLQAVLSGVIELNATIWHKDSCPVHHNSSSQKRNEYKLKITLCLQ